MQIFPRNGEPVTFLPLHRDKVRELRETLIQVQAEWIRLRYDSGLLFADDDIWQACTEAIASLPLADQSGQSWDLNQVGNDYEQLEKIFLTGNPATGEQGRKYFDFEADKLEPAALAKLHCFSGRAIAIEAFDVVKKENSDG